MLIILSILLTVFACKSEIVEIPETVKIPEEGTVPQDEKEKATTISSFPVLPEPSNLSNQVLVLKELRSGISYGFELVDTTVYHYNSDGEIIAEYFTNNRVGKQGAFYLRSNQYNVNPDNLNEPDKVYAHVTRYPLASLFLYCDEQKRVTKSKNEGRITFYEYDSEGRLSREVDNVHNRIILYSYFSKNETGLSYDYYTSQTFYNGSSTPPQVATYILSNTIKNQPKKYLFNYGIVSEYAIERIIKGDGLEISYNYTIGNNNIILEQSYKSGQYDLYTKYIYE